MPNMSGPCTARNLSVVLTLAPGNTGGGSPTHFSRTFTLRSSSAPTYPNSSVVISCTVLDPATTCNSLVATGTFAANDKVVMEGSYSNTNNTGMAAGDALFGWECQK